MALGQGNIKPAVKPSLILKTKILLINGACTALGLKLRQAEEATVACGLGLAAGEGKLGGAGQGLEWVA